ncbi:MAG: FkbM family methyltransferase [Pseudomonadota bacterium]
MITTRYLRDYASDFRPRAVVHLGAHHAGEMSEYEALRPEVVLWIDAVDDHLPVYQNRLLTLPEARRAHHRYRVSLITSRDDDARDFYEFSNKGSSSSIYRAAPELFEHWPSVSETGVVKRLKTSTLDSLLLREKDILDRLDMLVLDVQGAELECLRGAEHSLSRVRFLEVEASRVEIYQGGVLFKTLDPWITARGFVRRTGITRSKTWPKDMLVGNVVYERLT